MPEISITQMLKDFGVTSPRSQTVAKRALVKAGTISRRPNRVNISASKTDAARAVLEAAFLWHCGNGDCRREASLSSAPTLLVERQSCRICGGSGDRSALRRLGEAADKVGATRILVVGGTETKWREIRANSPAGVVWRFVDGVKSRDDRYFRGGRNWADVIVLWSSTPLDHRVSSHFTGKNDGRVVTVSRRGIASLADAVGDHLGRS